MSWATLHPVLLFLCSVHAAMAHVEPPANVTLHCRNLHNVLKWSYGQLPPGIKFRIDIGATVDLNGSPDVLWVSPPAELQANVSFLSDPETDYYIAVTAVIGQNESHVAPHDGISFSYYKDSPADQKCFVDFPTVHLTAQKNNTVLVRFTHPWLVYHQRFPNRKPRKKKSHDAKNSPKLPGFSYDVEIITQKERHHNSVESCEDSVCENELQVDPAQEKHCLRIKGDLLKILVRGTQEYCVLPYEESSSSYLIQYCIVGILLAFSAAAFVIYMGYRKLTTPSSSLPDSMKITSKLKQLTLGNPQETCFVPEVGPVSPTPLLSTEEKDFTPTVTPSTVPDLRLRLGVTTEDEGMSVDVEEKNDEGPGYMKGRHLDEDDELHSSEVPSGYEKRPVLVELAPDELAEGYRG
ncbi:interferon gamma receptor 1-like [Sebastes umbrosus]|uniref:interferon gamma receptor 1-like n=1 Tax=Sebastes umbrosus TaxID=72105 RepID=UPI0018A0BF6E|nr:interferon gamma receptor 1-like [Sebastes umbrosus]